MTSLHCSFDVICFLKYAPNRLILSPLVSLVSYAFKQKTVKVIRVKITKVFQKGVIMGIRQYVKQGGVGGYKACAYVCIGTAHLNLKKNTL